MVRLVVAVLLLGAKGALAQPEIVPAEHPVYAFLADQRVAGVLPEYRYEALPHGRSTVQRMLDSLAVRRGRLGAAGRFWLGEYRREFFEPLDGVHSYVGDGEAGLLDPNAERTWFYHRSDDWRIAVTGEGTVQVRTAEDGALSPGGVARVATLTFEGNWRRRLGIYTSTLAGTQMTGDTRVLRSDPVLAPLFYVSVNEVPAGPFDRTTASLRTEAGPFSAEIANERLRYGASADQPLVLGDGADYLPFVRLGLHSKVVDVQAVHAALSDRSVFVTEPDGTNYLTSPDRYLALHRLEVQPVSWASAAFTEMAVYGFRGVEVAYLNPLFPVKAAEHAMWDRDNTLFTLEATLRPLPGAEVYGTWLVDDLKTSTLGDADYGNKWAIQAGVKATVPRSGVTAFGEYTRIEPYTYTHRFQQEGSFYNSYVHNGFGLGHPLGPNADQWLAGVQAWLPFRTRIRALARYVRQGENPVDPLTGEVTQVGGDVANGAFPGFGPDTKAFLAGDLYEGPGVQGLVEVEPVNGIALRLFGDAQWWRGRPDRTFLRFELAVRP